MEDRVVSEGSAKREGREGGGEEERTAANREERKRAQRPSEEGEQYRRCSHT